MTLRISEIFVSIQGEGMWLGTPSTFVRVSGCNLRCAWCDTPYASWKPEGPVVEIAEIVREIEQRSVRHVVLTGGEPMLFDAIEPLAAELHDRAYVITVETAGTIYRDLPCELMSISPKLAHSAPDEGSGWQERHERLRLDYDVLRKLVRQYNHQLKFVVSASDAEGQAREIRDILAAIGDVQPDRVMLMAEGRDAAQLHANERALVPACVREGWRLTPRYQIDLFGDTRGT